MDVVTDDTPMTHFPSATTSRKICVLQRMARKLHHARQLLRIDPRTDVPQSRVSARCADRSDLEHGRHLNAADDLGSPCGFRGDYKYYFSNVPFLALWDRSTSGFRGVSEFLSDAAQGTLPAVSFLDPRSRSSTMARHDDHPHADLRRG